MTSSNRTTRIALRKTLGPSPLCIPLDQIGDMLTAAQRQHLDSCARCQTEVALWNEFARSEPRTDELEAVRWVADAVRQRRRRAGQPIFTNAMRAWRAIAATAAALIIGVSIGYIYFDREPRVRELQRGPQTYRTAGLELRTQLGDQETAPTVLEWIAVPGASWYDVSLVEVDRTVLWNGSFSTTRVALPEAVIARLVPGKTVFWKVTARDSSDAVIADSGAQRFRVKLKKGAGE